MLRFTLAAILVVAAVAAIWIERGHRVLIDAPAMSESPSIVATVACPDTDAVPYSAACLDYLNVSTDPVPAPCPDSDRVPYSPSCIAFLKGATETGMRWRATAGPMSIPGP